MQREKTDSLTVFKVLQFKPGRAYELIGAPYLPIYFKKRIFQELKKRQK